MSFVPEMNIECLSLENSNDWNLHQSLVAPEKKVAGSMLDKYKVLI